MITLHTVLPSRVRLIVTMIYATDDYSTHCIAVKSVTAADDDVCIR